MTGTKGTSRTRSTGRGRGAGGGGAGGTGGGGGDDEFRCDNVDITTFLNSPVASVLARINEGDCLEVKMMVFGERRVVAALHGGELAGTLTGGDMEKVRQCLAMSEPFRAIVLEVGKGRCQVKVLSGACP